MAFAFGCAKKEEVTPPPEEGTGTLSGVITLSDQTGPGADHSGIKVSLANTAFEATTAKDGSFKIKEIPSGLYTVEMSKEGYVSREEVVEIGAGKEVSIKFALERAAIISGKVFLQGQTDHSRITVVVKGTELSTTTGPDGSFEIVGVPPGSHILLISKGKEYKSAEIPVEVSPGQAITLEPVTLLVAKLEVKLIQPTTYEVVEDLKVGDMYYIDRTYTIKSLPAGFEAKKLVWIKTANGDKASTGRDFLVFEVNVPVIVWLIHDKRVPVTAWMTELKFEKTDLTMGVTDSGADPLEVFKAEFPAGKISLGGNEGPGNSMYVVAIEAR